VASDSTSSVSPYKLLVVGWESQVNTSLEDEVFVLNPFVDRVARYHLESEIERERDVFQQSREAGYTERLFDANRQYLGQEPRPAGLIPWGGDQSGGTAYWETTHPGPERWTVYIATDTEVIRYEENMSTLIVNALRGRETPLFWPEWRCPVRYVPWS
jgi:hypothetical protein